MLLGSLCQRPTLKSLAKAYATNLVSVIAAIQLEFYIDEKEEATFSFSNYI